MQRDPIKVRCQDCRTPGTVTRTLLARTQGHMACGTCRKTTAWRAA